MNARIGGDMVVEALSSLGATCVVGVPGQHALGLFDALRRGTLRFLGARIENNAGMMADGIARATWAPAPLLLSTGPGALTALAALMESKGSNVPIVAISAQVPVAGLGGGRHGYLHELDDQAASFAQVVKHAVTVRSIAQIVPAIAEAWAIALRPPQGPVLVEIPQDVLLKSVPDDLPIVDARVVDLALPTASEEILVAAARTLSAAKRPLVLAGGGVARAQAGNQLMALAERLDAPVYATFSGRNAVPARHPLSAGSWLEDIATTEHLESADVLLVVGSGLGELSSNYHSFSPRGRIIQIDADLEVIGSNHPVIGVHSDAAIALERLTDLVTASSEIARRQARLAEVSRVRDAVTARLASQQLDRELDLLRALRTGVPDDADTYWDMTMAAYWAWSAWDRRDGEFASAQGAGGLGFAFPAALGAAFASGRRTVAVSGDGGAMYGIAELATAVQHSADVTWVIIDDGAYTVLEEYMIAAFGEAMATRIHGPDFVALARSFEVPARDVEPESLAAALAETFAERGPRVIVVRTALRLFAPTHLGRESRA